MVPVLAKKYRIAVLVSLLIVSAAGVLLMGIRTYQDAPPVPDFTGPSGTTLISRAEILRGQNVFLKYALMEYGSMFGDGGGRGPDFTAEALHQMALQLTTFYAQRQAAKPAGDAATTETWNLGIAEKVKKELKKNTYNAATNRAELSEARSASVLQIRDYYRKKFTSSGLEAFQPTHYISDENELSDLAAFFFWGAWVCSAARPGSAESYTHNWPYDELAGNTATSATLFWSVAGAFAFILALGFVLYLYGQQSAAPDNSLMPVKDAPRVMSAEVIPTPTQRAVYKFFAAAALIFLIQVISGILTIHDFVGFTVFFGVDLAQYLPLTVSRSWHVQLSILWIAASWIGGSLFIIPIVSKAESKTLRYLIHVIFWLLLLVFLGGVAGNALGPKNMLGEWWRSLGHQGWEFVEIGKLWQWLLFAALILWAVVLYKGLKPGLAGGHTLDLPRWIIYATVAIVILFASGFVAGERTNFAIADFWRWMVIHMWAECFFEVFTSIIVAWYLVMMGIISAERANRIVYIAAVLFLGSGLMGISHNFYWNAKPEITLALGSIFSTLQVIPLILLTLEAYRFRRLARQADSAAAEGLFLSEAFLFLLGVNFWNFLGAGVFGFIINLPIVNYYEHGTYLTVNHGHAALMGVYGNLSLAAMLFCSRYLVRKDRWNRSLVRMAFWSLNVGLLLMVLLDLFPAGILQLRAVLESGLWYARSQEFINGTAFQTLTWMRILGGAVFFLGGVIPLTWFFISRWFALRKTEMESSLV